MTFSLPPAVSRTGAALALGGLAVLTGLLGDTPVKHHGFWRFLFFMLGAVFTAVAALGRFYAAASTPGASPQGAYALCRQPLYLFSLLGLMGIAMMAGSLLAFLCVSAGFLFISDRLIAKAETPDDENSPVPRLLPAPGAWRPAPSISMTRAEFMQAVAEAALWLSPILVLALANMLHALRVIRPVVTVF